MHLLQDREGEAPAHRVYEDDRTLVFMDIFAVSRGHTLIIPSCAKSQPLFPKAGKMPAKTSRTGRIGDAGLAGSRDLALWPLK